MQNSIPKFRENFKNIETLMSSTIEFKILGWNFTHVFYFLQKGVRPFFHSSSSWVINKNVKNLVSVSV